MRPRLERERRRRTGRRETERGREVTVSLPSELSKNLFGGIKKGERGIEAEYC